MGEPAEAVQAEDPVADGQRRVGVIVSVNGSFALVMLDDDRDVARAERPQLGAIMSIDAGDTVVLGFVSAMSAPAPNPDRRGEEVRLIELELIGEFKKPTPRAPARFRRGVSSYPTLGDTAHAASRHELAALFASGASTGVRVGVVRQDASIPAVVGINELFSRHCAVVGSTGVGKSSAVVLMLRAVVERYSNAHIVVIDPHNEYGAAFGDAAVVLDMAEYNLPYWTLNFDELSDILYPDKSGVAEELEILAELVTTAKKLNYTALKRAAAERGGRGAGDINALTVNSPTPYRISEVVGLIDKTLGGLESTHAVAPFKRLRGRLQAVSNDVRYASLFGGRVLRDNFAEMLSAIFRIPSHNAPISVLQLGGLPDEVGDIVVAAVARLAFDIGQSARGEAPIALVVEDAHRYAPGIAEGAGDRLSRQSAAHRALLKIGKEGRKNGVSLWISSARPTDVDPSLLALCNTFFAMRLANQSDQDALRTAAPDASSSLLGCLPSLGLGEAIAFGEGVAMPMRMRFDALPRGAVPKGLTTSFTDQWSNENDEELLIERLVDQWRAQRALAATD
ncbi:MAG: ATP-binding protein [Pseudomonadota bacterium]